MLEAALAAHQKALEANTAALSAFLAHIGSTKSNPATTARPQPAPQQPPAKQEQSASPAAEQKSLAVVLDYTKDVRPVAVRLIDKDRAKMVEILTKHGVKLATELKADKLPAFLADVKAALGEK